MGPNQILDLSSMYMVGLIGLFAGGVASYLANLLLAEEGYMSLPQLGSCCGHKDSIVNAIPFVSLLLLDNRCANCKRRIKWQYPLVEVLTAVAFCALAWRLGLSFYSAGMMFFVAVLIAICITDFKAKIIPHEITYPAILTGIVFSALTKTGILGHLAGIGFSYIFFDFLAFYGLKFYLWFNRPVSGLGNRFISIERKISHLSKKTSFTPTWISKELQPVSKRVGNKEYAKQHVKGVPLEELEIIGGGDAVLSALISAWLGWQKLVMALVLGFLIGTVLGAIYVLVELKKERLLKSIVSTVLICMVGMSIFATFMLFLLAVSLKESVFLMPYQYILPGAALIGSLLGVIIAGSKTAKPFPFGPALAAGAIITIFRHA